MIPAHSTALSLFPANRTMVMDPDRSCVVKQDVPPRFQQPRDRVITAFEGSGKRKL